MPIELPTGTGAAREEMLERFAEELKAMAPDFKMSSRGWCYYLEGAGIVTKGNFDKVQDVINECRKKALIPVDFCAQDKSRSFLFTEAWYTESTPAEFVEEELKDILELEGEYSPYLWDEEEYYIQMLVEKIDLVELFRGVCHHFCIPVATAKGWSDINQRAEMAVRFMKHEEVGRTPVLLYCGDHDPMGIKISDTLLKNFQDIEQAYVEEVGQGWDPSGLIVDRFGLNIDFIMKHKLSWIDNLETGTGRNLADPSHPDHYKSYVQEYLQKYGARKVEANAVVTVPDAARQMCIDAIKVYLGHDAVQRFTDRREEAKKEVARLIVKSGISASIKRAFTKLKKI